jgi:hypothetical protein
VDDPGDVGVGDDLLYELEFGGARQAVAGGDRPDGTAVEGEPVAIVGKLVDLGHVSLGVQDSCQAGHGLAEGLAGKLFTALFDALAPEALEHAGEEFGVFVFYVAEQFDCEVTGGGPGEEGFAQFRTVVEVSWPAGSAPLLAGGDEAGGAESGQMLADGARGDPQRVGHRFG